MSEKKFTISFGIVKNKKGNYYSLFYEFELEPRLG